MSDKVAIKSRGAGPITMWAVMSLWAFVVMVFAWWWIWSVVPSGDEKWSIFAELYGGAVGALFSAFAFAGLIVTIILQDRQLRAASADAVRAAEADTAAKNALAEQLAVSRLTGRLNAATALLTHHQSRLSYLDIQHQQANNQGPAHAALIWRQQEADRSLCAKGIEDAINEINSIKSEMPVTWHGAAHFTLTSKLTVHPEVIRDSKGDDE